MSPYAEDEKEMKAKSPRVDIFEKGRYIEEIIIFLN